MFYEMDDSHYSSKSILSKRIYRTYGGSSAKLLMFSLVGKKHMTVKCRKSLSLVRVKMGLETGIAWLLNMWFIVLLQDVL